MIIWNEFRNVILPLLIAVAVVFLVVNEKRRSEDLFAQSNGQIVKAVEGIQTLLQESGYRVPPMGGTP
jgi:hypothetical protein